MALGIYFPEQSMSSAKYAEVLGKLEAAGQAAPAGRLYHVSFGKSDNLEVFDIWESQEAFEAFGKVLLPILAELGMESVQPSIQPINNIIVGS